MKIIISHDVDHIKPSEHINDLIIPKFLVRSFIECCLHYISFFELISRFRSILSNRWNNIDELMLFDNENNIPSTFFVGVNRGLGLNYSLQDSKIWINRLLDNGSPVGVHGISYDNIEEIQKEYEIFKKISQQDSFGIRMHYLRCSNRTLKFMENTGYLYDSSVYEIKNPYMNGKMWEFPLHLMDSYLFYSNKGLWRNQSLAQVKKQTIKKVNDAFSNGIKYFTILSHDREFSESFKTSRDWYIWLIAWLKDNGFQFINYNNAILEMNKNYDRIS